MEQQVGYFCRAYVGQDVQANVIARTLLEAELEIARMIRSGANFGPCEYNMAGLTMNRSW